MHLLTAVPFRSLPGAWGRELAHALVFLTRLPVPLGAPVPPLARCLWAFPLAGAVVGGIGAALLAGAGFLGVPPLAAAFLALAGMALLTGALHEDGLADLADGLGGGRGDRDRALTIMRDSRVGAFGVLAVVLAVGLRASALAPVAEGLSEEGWEACFAGVVIAAALGRAVGGLVAGLMPPARTDGLGAALGERSRGALAFCALLPVGGAFLGVPPGAALAMVGAAALAGAVVAWRAWRGLGGQTGDVAGAAGLCAETAGLLALAAMI